MCGGVGGGANEERRVIPGCVEATALGNAMSVRHAGYDMGRGWAGVTPKSHLPHIFIAPWELVLDTGLHAALNARRQPLAPSTQFTPRPHFLTHRPSPWESALDSVLHAAHNTLTGLEFVRVLTGAGTRTRDLPPSLVDYVPCSNDVGGFFDNHERARKAR